MTERDTPRKRVLLGVTGSIAAYKAVEVLRRLTAEGVSVRVLMTDAATRFVGPATFEALSGAPVVTSMFAPEETQTVSHVRLPQEADLFLVVPASANFLAKAANGFSDDAVTASFLSARIPKIVAPAMESGMWMNPATARNVAALLRDGVEFLGPTEGPLASTSQGVGRMLEPGQIASHVLARIRGFASGALRGVKMVVTAGPTWEALDPVRFLSNRSTGAMGLAIAEAAAHQGAQVCLILGPTHLVPPSGVETVRVESAEEMLRATLAASEGATVLVAAAAVSDYRPRERATQKRKREGQETQMDLIENPDVLKSAAKGLRAQSLSPAIVVGFAAETEGLEQEAIRKLHTKDCDLVVANRVGAGQGFGPETPADLFLFDRGGPRGQISASTKREAAERLVLEIARLRERAEESGARR
jgi:phosphopantothenoylcysteine decarboxylase / phosphopantothenate---cysteine ligase